MTVISVNTGELVEAWKAVKPTIKKGRELKGGPEAWVVAQALDILARRRPFDFTVDDEHAFTGLNPATERFLSRLSKDPVLGFNLPASCALSFIVHKATGSKKKLESFFGPVV